MKQFIERFFFKNKLFVLLQNDGKNEKQETIKCIFALKCKYLMNVFYNYL